jgi:hypothetical protein
LKTVSAIGGAAGVDDACPLVITTADNQIMATTATPAIECFDLFVISPPTIPIRMARSNASFFHPTYSRIGFDRPSRQ